MGNQNPWERIITGINSNSPRMELPTLRRMDPDLNPSLWAQTQAAVYKQQGQKCPSLLFTTGETQNVPSDSTEMQREKPAAKTCRSFHSYQPPPSPYLCLAQVIQINKNQSKHASFFLTPEKEQISCLWATIRKQNISLGIATEVDHPLEQKP